MIEVTWIGWDGSYWDLMRGPLRLTRQAMDVLGMFDSEAFVRTSAYVHGQRVDGWKALPREFDLQVATAQAGLSEMAWFGIDSAWKRTMRPDCAGQIIVADPAGGVRTLTARMTSEANGLQTDPSGVRRTVLTYGMVADDPWWYGKPQTETFTPPKEQVNFFGPTGYGPSFFIAPASTPNAAVLLNPGDVDVWPVWTFHGPAPRFSAVVEGQAVSGEFAIAAGSWITVDTREFRKSAIRADGENVTRQLSSRRYTRIPTGENVDIAVSVFPDSRVDVVVHPQFFRGYS